MSKNTTWLMYSEEDTVTDKVMFWPARNVCPLVGLMNATVGGGTGWLDVLVWVMKAAVSLVIWLPGARNILESEFALGICEIRACS